ncbi:hypothetical protein R4Y45_06190 [Holzapfeliella sp. He02]|uniref:Uncharacterized protein n=1 Tax=Holzapfeliella saturejae TaxID=3082953 RepID=A0ABU8SHH6_9LACO
MQSTTEATKELMNKIIDKELQNRRCVLFYKDGYPADSTSINSSFGLSFLDLRGCISRNKLNELTLVKIEADADNTEDINIYFASDKNVIKKESEQTQKDFEEFDKFVDTVCEVAGVPKASTFQKLMIISKLNE